MDRISKQQYYLNIADSVSQRSTCLRKHYGAIIVNNDEIISTGYNGAPRHTLSCYDNKECLKHKLHTSQGVAYDTSCLSVHAEQNAIISASRRDMIDGILYLSCRDAHTNELCDCMPCNMCIRLIINAGIKRVITNHYNPNLIKNIEVSMWIRNFYDIITDNPYSKLSDKKEI